MHRALADATDPDLDPDRRVWHLSSATVTPDEEVAAALEQASVRARSRGGIAAAAAFLDRAAQLTPDPKRRGARSLAAAQAKSQAGEYADAIELLDAIRLEPVDQHDQAYADLVRGRILFASQSATNGLPVLLGAARRLETLDPRLATETYRDAIYAALTAGSIRRDPSVEQVASAILKMPSMEGPPGSTLLLEGLARVVIEGYGAGVALLQRGLAEYQPDRITAEDGLGWFPLACRMAHDAWEFDAWSSLSRVLVDLANDAGALSVLPSAQLLRLSNRTYAGDLAAAEALVAQSATLGDVTGSSFFAHYGALVTAPWRGDEAETREVIDVVTHDLRLQGEGKVLTATEWAAAVLYNGLGDFDRGLEAARRGAGNPQEMGLSTWSMFELVEAASRLDRVEDAAESVTHLQKVTQASRTPWAMGTFHLVTAMVSEGAAAEEHYREAINQIERTEVRMVAARTYLSYGEWLRREGRRADARARLSLAHDLLTQIGASGFAERARRELAAAGAATPVRTTTATDAPLTAQELQIARLAAEGLTNPEIGAQMFISAHTVEWHLRKVFTKLGIRSRKDIAVALPD
jgi:DNA-binding CsgD family transcriptional regulator